jgi:hypothetical protein
MPDEARFAIPFHQIGSKDVALVGGKNAWLGEMIASLQGGRHPRAGIASISVSPDSFAEVKTRVAEAERELD